MLWKQTSSVWNAIALQTGRLKGCSQKIFPLPISVENILSQSRNGPSSVVTSHYIVFINFTHPNRYQRIKLPLHQTWQQKVPMSSSMIFKYLHIFSCFKFPDAPFISFRDIGDSADAVGAGDPTSHPVPLGGLHSRQRPGPGGDLFGFEGGAMMGTTGTTALALAQRVVPPGTLGGSCLHHVYVVFEAVHITSYWHTCYHLLLNMLVDVPGVLALHPRDPWFLHISTKKITRKPFQRLSMTLWGSHCHQRCTQRLGSGTILAILCTAGWGSQPSIHPTASWKQWDGGVRMLEKMALMLDKPKKDVKWWSIDLAKHHLFVVQHCWQAHFSTQMSPISQPNSQKNSIIVAKCSQAVGNLRQMWWTSLKIFEK